MTKAKTAKAPLLKRGAAKTRYLAMGEGRSLKKLHAAIVADGKYRAPGITTLKIWSREEKWVEVAREHDAQVAAAASSKAIEAESDQRVALARSLRKFSTDGIAKALEMLALVKAANVDDIETLVKASVEASKQAEVLDAGAPNQIPGSAEDDEALRIAAEGGTAFFAHIMKLTGARPAS